ncbi:Methyltransferase domain-containing protein [Enhydrobacter aerosaccus]|uniref:Methyltransferase domain-containing protein n=1 Tax=Enhydrobacter aerosaccus TaxID=225324 RepID=A0A1T4TFK2_9HYPH|nr:class I SAM-dependent methyltransferase [Enhydrobacter aerosaccus]SKA39212.1 Methyltransferase domain-containing protein [Enhydrobacter aerosaccus]
MDLKEEDILGDDIARHWYYRSKAAALRQVVKGLKPRRILDVGAGSGFFSRHLLTEGGGESALCVDVGYDRNREETVAGKPMLFRRDCGPTDCDLVLMMDVLEHVKDDSGLVRHYAAKVPSGAHFLVTVPAFQFLWSGHDVFLDHCRRYRLGEIEETMRKAGLTVVRGAYYFGFIFPLAAAVRLATRHDTTPKSSLTRHGAVTNALLTAVCKAELPLLPFNRLAGLSAFVLARKP